MAINLKAFKSHVSEEHLVAEGQRVLLAVSGGRDSVTLLDLMCRAGYSVGIAHCNFHLRPGDCDRDEAFVRNLAAQQGLRCHVAQFDTIQYATDKGLSVEEAARDLRYRYFDEVRVKDDYDLIATAHHRDDAIETFFINLLRGAGIGGLHGIRARNGYVVRPLLLFGRDEIDAYVAERGLSYVEDCTNSQLLYLRNRIRLQLMPLLRELSPSFDSVIESNMRHLSDAEQIYRQAIEEHRVRVMARDNQIDIAELRRCEPLETMLYEFLRPFGFNAALVSQIVASLDSQSGKQFFSSTHRLVKDRGRLIITERGNEEEEYLVDGDCDVSNLPFHLEMSIVPFDGKVCRLPKNEAWFDKRGLHFPLKLRHWRDGDRFRPFGMKGTRLVSDFFSDMKLSLDEKERIWLLCDGDENGTILWIVGLRAAHCAVVNTTTKEVVKLLANNAESPRS